MPPNLAMVLEGCPHVKQEWPALPLGAVRFPANDEGNASLEVDAIESDVAYASALQPHGSSKRTLPIRYSEKRNQAAFEGFLVCHDPVGNVLPVFFQNKLYNNVFPSQIATWADKVHTFATETLKLARGKYYVLIFCTRHEAANLNSPQAPLREGTIVVLRAGCEALLAPYRASELVELAL